MNDNPIASTIHNICVGVTFCSNLNKLYQHIFYRFIVIANSFNPKFVINNTLFLKFKYCFMHIQRCFFIIHGQNYYKSTDGAS